MDIKQTIKILNGEIYEYEEIFSYLPEQIQNNCFLIAEYALIIYKKALELKKYADEGVCEELLPFAYDAFKYYNLGLVLIPDELFINGTSIDIKECISNFDIIYQNALKNIDKLKMDKRVLYLSYDVGIGVYENYDGSGYPCGILGEDCPVMARICKIAIDYLSLTTNSNDYQIAYENAVIELIKNSNTLYDPALVNIFISCLDQINEITYLYSDKNIIKA